MKRKTRFFLLVLLFTGIGFVASPLSAHAEGEPYFSISLVQSMNTPEGINTALTAQISDPNGSIPGTITTFTVEGPGGFSYGFIADNYIQAPNVYWHQILDTPMTGQYTFTVTDAEGKTAVNYCYLQAGDTVPLPDSTSFQASGDPLSPTLSWGAISAFGGNVYYRARIYDTDSNVVWTSGFTTITSITVPSGILAQGTPYQWGVEAFDNYHYFASSYRASSQVIPLTIDNSRPHFRWACVYSGHNQLPFYTGLIASVVDPDGTPPVSISSCSVTGPGVNHAFQPNELFQHGDEYIYFHQIDVKPQNGIYTFSLTDDEQETAVTYDYVKVQDVPIIDSATLQASGNPLSPALSWGAPANMDQSLYFEVLIQDNQGHDVWQSWRTANTYLDVPGGILQDGVSYQWQVRALDDNNWVHYDNRSNSNFVDLAIDNSRPYFGDALVYKVQTSGGFYMQMGTRVFDPNGTVPNSIETLTVTGPGLNYIFQPEDYSGDGQFFHGLPGKPVPGCYTFTVTDNENYTAVTHDYVGAADDIPLIDESTISVSGNPLAPTISWANIHGYEGHLYYRVWVDDLQHNRIYLGGREPFTAQTIPQGYIQAGKSYLFRVEAYDHRGWVIYNSRSNSNWLPLTQGPPGSISGQVTGPNGPIRGLWMQAFAGPCWNTWIGGADTEEDGNYTIENLPSGNVYVQACATCNHFNYIDEWYDANNGTTNCNKAAPVTVLSDQNTPGVNFDLERGPKRLSSFDATVYNGTLSVGFDIYPGFDNQLVSATIDLARETKYEFDLENDLFVWDSECRYVVAWGHDFGEVQPADYGDYTLTLVFSDGAQEIHTFTLQEVSVKEVASINVTVNDDGSVHVSWNRQTADNYYYQVRVRDDAGKEIYRAGSQLNINQIDIPANNLRCLELGKTYRWLVRVYDLNYYRAETRETTKQYSPSALTNRTSSVYAWAWNGSLNLGFDVRPGSRDNIDHVTVTWPNGFSYPFDLVADRFDISTETRLGMKGWGKMFDLGPNGTYNFEVAFEDGHTENPQTNLNAVPVTPVDSATMQALIYADGAITFSWDLPEEVTGQKYQVRIRSQDGSKEYYSSPTQEDMTTVTASFWDLRAMEPGQTYQWFVRAWSEDFSTMEQSGSLTFLYDPFPTYNPGAAVFGPDSANITNIYIPMELGGRLTYTGTGALVGYGHYVQAVAVETVDSVSCMKVLIRGDGNNPDPDQDPEYSYAWVAQDNVGNVWLFAYEEHEDGDVETYVFGKSDAPLLMPAAPKAGQIFFQRGDEYQQVQATGVTVELGTGLDPFTDCLKVLDIYRANVRNIAYMAPDIGTVKEEWDLQWDPKGWELLTYDTDADLMPDDWEQSYFGDLSHDGTADGDEDELTDLQEYQHGTDPTASDTDSDDMPDGWEVAYGLNPLVDDADGNLDGDDYTNLEEYERGSHPNNWEPDQPVLLSPEDEAIDVSLTPTLETAAFSDTDGDGHAATDWQISTDETDEASFSENLVLDVSCDTNLTSLTVPQFILSVSDADPVIPAYYWRARFHDDGDAKSEWSEIFSFTTIDAASSDDTDQDGVPDEQEITDPEVDLDEDGDSDMTQADMKCVNTVVGDGQIAVKADANVASVDSIESIDPAAIADTVNKPADMPLGLITFKVTVINPDDPATVIVYMSEPAPTGAKWYKYDPVNGWQDYSAHATFSGDRRSVTLELQDGVYGDADGLKNGFIIDPSGAGTVTAPAPGPGPAPGGGAAAGGGGGGGCFIDTAGSEFRR